jgi:hypothetical protein
MSACGPKRTFLVAPHMSAFGGKADISGMKPEVRIVLIALAVTALVFAAFISLGQPF